MSICYFCERNISILDSLGFKSKDVWSMKTMHIVGKAHEKCLLRYEKYGLDIFKKNMSIEQQALYPKEIIGSRKK